MKGGTRPPDGFVLGHGPERPPRLIEKSGDAGKPWEWEQDSISQPLQESPAIKFFGKIGA